MVRPTALTPELQERICTAIRAGAPPETAAIYAGVAARTYYRWMARGEREQRGEFWQFCRHGSNQATFLLTVGAGRAGNATGAGAGVRP